MICTAPAGKATPTPPYAYQGLSTEPHHRRREKSGGSEEREGAGEVELHAVEQPLGRKKSEEPTALVR